ncbi:unnamed protein product [Sphagnum tenellum]
MASFLPSLYPSRPCLRLCFAYSQSPLACSLRLSSFRSAASTGVRSLCTKNPASFCLPGSHIDGGIRPWFYGTVALQPLSYGSNAKGYTAPPYGSESAAGVGVIEEVKGLEVQELGDEGATFSDVREQDKVRGTGGGGGKRGDWNGGGRGGGGDGEGGPHEEEPPKKKMSTSQKLTLAYAALVGGECFSGGVIGFLKSGSSKSLLAGGGSAFILYYVYLNLSVNPALSSAIGLGISSMLLFVMGSRFKNSGKIFPAGVVALSSFIMAGGYIHGILRTSHV